MSEARTTLPAYSFKSGAIYTGEWIGNSRDGYGVQQWPDGAKYEGLRNGRQLDRQQGLRIWEVLPRRRRRLRRRVAKRQGQRQRRVHSQKRSKALLTLDMKASVRTTCKTARGSRRGWTIPDTTASTKWAKSMGSVAVIPFRGLLVERRVEVRGGVGRQQNFWQGRAYCRGNTTGQTAGPTTALG